VVIRFLRLSLLAGFALLAAGPALAQIKAWPAQLELFGGYNATKELDGAGVFGVRLGGMIREPFGADVSASFLRADALEEVTAVFVPASECEVELVEGACPTKIGDIRRNDEIHRWAVDASVVRYRKKPETKAWLAVLGGIGFASTRTERTESFPADEAVCPESLVGGLCPLQRNSTTDNSISFHAGIAAKLFFGKRYYVRPDMRARMVADGEHRRCWEGSIAFGFVLRQQ
jgi:hypothetical protein